MSVSVTNTEGMEIVVQVFPERKKDAAKRSPKVATSLSEQTTKTSTEKPKPKRQRLLCLMKQLGVVQILIGTVTVCLGVTLLVGDSALLMAPLWCGCVYVMSGGLALFVMTREDAHVTMLKGMFLMHIACALVAGTGAAASCVSLARVRARSNCAEVIKEYSDRPYYWDCKRLSDMSLVAAHGLNGLLLVLSVFQFCVAVAISVFSMKAIGHSATRPQESVEFREVEATDTVTMPSENVPPSEA